MGRTGRGMTGKSADAHASALPLSRVQIWVARVIVVLTFFFVIVTPPFQAPDENQHYYKALSISTGQWQARKHGDLIGAWLPSADVDIHRIAFPTDGQKEPRRFSTGQIHTGLAQDRRADEPTFAEFPNVASYAPTLYLPGAAGLAVGKAAGLSPLATFYLGRVVNALCGLGLLLTGLRLLPFGRNALLATALLPTFSYQTGSLSPDAVINGLGFLGLALALRCGFTTKKTHSDGGLFLVAPLLALCKGVYLPIMAAGLRWPGRGNRSTILLLGAMAFGAAMFVAWMHISGGSQALYYIQSRKTGQSVMTAPLADQLAVILADPVGFIHVFISSVIERSPVYVIQVVGRFGWNAIMLPLFCYPLAAIMLMAGVASGNGRAFGMGQRLWWLLIAAGVATLIETAMYLTGTPLGADYIQGTQGRYFLPIVPLILMALSPSQALQLAPRAMVIAGTILAMIAALSVADSFWRHGFVTSDGLPPIDDKLNALLLPSPRW